MVKLVESWRPVIVQEFPFVALLPDESTVDLVRKGPFLTKSVAVAALWGDFSRQVALAQELIKEISLEMLVFGRKVRLPHQLHCIHQPETYISDRTLTCFRVSSCFWAGVSESFVYIVSALVWLLKGTWFDTQTTFTSSSTHKPQIYSIS